MSCVLQGVEELKRPSCQPWKAPPKVTPGGFVGRWSGLVEKEGKEVALQTVTVSETDTDRNQVTLASAFFCLLSNPVLQMHSHSVQKFKDFQLKWMQAGMSTTLWWTYLPGVYINMTKEIHT